MRLILYVSQEDIDSGWKQDAEQCPMAQSLRRRGFYCPSVFCSIAPEVIEAWRGDWCFRWKFTKRAEHFSNRFDAGKTVAPQRFVFRFIERFYDPLPVEPEDLDGLYEEA